MATMIDSAVLMRQALLSTATPAGAALVAQVSQRIYMGEYPGNDEWKNAVKAIVGFRSTGGNEMQCPLVRTRFAFECYGGSKHMKDANAVYRVLHDRLREIEMEAYSQGAVMNCTEESGPDDLWDERREWPFIVTVWTVEMKAAKP